jgi:hypothetical protein
LFPLQAPIAQTLSLALIPIGLVAVGLYALSVELYFHTKDFVEEYNEQVASLVIAANGQISARIEQLSKMSTGSGLAKQATLGTILPIAVEDVTEQLLTEIREIGAEADDWMDCLARGKSQLRNASLWLALDATVVVAIVFILTLSVPVDLLLVFEYAGGPPTILLLYSVLQFRRIETKLDKARIR